MTTIYCVDLKWIFACTTFNVNSNKNDNELRIVNIYGHCECFLPQMADVVSPHTSNEIIHHNNNNSKEDEEEKKTPWTMCIHTEHWTSSTVHQKQNPSNAPTDSQTPASIRVRSHWQQWRFSREPVVLYDWIAVNFMWLPHPTLN